MVSFISARRWVRRVHSCRRWWDVCRSRPHGHGSAVLFGCAPEGDLLQKTHESARVSAQSTPCRWVGKVNEGFESGSSCFQRCSSWARACVWSQILVVRAWWQGFAWEVPSFVSASARSFPTIPQCEGHQTVLIFQPSSRSCVAVSRARRAYSWLSQLNSSVSIAALLSMHMKAVERGMVVVRRAAVASWKACSPVS